MKNMVCTQCPLGCEMEAGIQGKELVVRGNKCPKGRVFAWDELTVPRRTLTTTVRTKFADFPMLPVKTDRDVPLEKIREILRHLDTVVVTRRLQLGEVVAVTKVAKLVATDDMTVGREDSEGSSAVGH